MRAPIRTLVVVAAVLAAISGCTGDDGVPSIGPASTELATGGTGDSSGEDRAWVEASLASMTIEEKVGQLFVARVHGTTADTTELDAVRLNIEELGVANAVELVGAFHPGGVVFFGENVTTPVALAEFTNALQTAVGTQRSQIPLLTSIDQEQGNVVRVGPPATQFPGSMALGASRSREDAGEAARITGDELRAMGIFQDYAPDADVNINPANPVIGVRSFSSRPSLVSSMVDAQVRGYQSAGIAATAKHFPGHGDTSIDSHTGLPMITHSRAQLRRVDLRPFRAAIAAGVDAIMTAHIQVPALDESGDPATLSEPIVTGVLRDKLGFDGVVVTDSLRMEGVRTTYGDERIPVLAILAGVDQLLDPPNLPTAYSAVLSAVADGEITMARLDESVRRILGLKAKLGLTDVDAALVNADAVEASVGSPASLSAAVGITDRTTTIVKDSPSRIPVERLDGARILVTGWGESAKQALAEALRQRGADASVLDTGIDPGPGEIRTAQTQSAGMDLVLVTSYSVTTHPKQAALVDALTAIGRPLVVAAVGTPYDISLFPEVQTFVATYSYQPVAMQSLVRVLAGEVSAVGRLPVEIPVDGNPEKLLYPFGWSVRG